MARCMALYPATNSHRTSSVDGLERFSVYSLTGDYLNYSEVGTYDCTCFPVKACKNDYENAEVRMYYEIKRESIAEPST